MSGTAGHGEPYAVLCRDLGIADADDIPVDVHGQDPVTPSVHRIGDACAAALAALGREVALVSRDRGIDAGEVTVSVEAAIPQLMAAFLNSVNGVPSSRTMEDPTLLSDCDFYAARDGRHVYLMLAYPHLRDIACRVLGCPPGKESIAAAIARWDAFELEAAVAAEGGTAVAVRTREEWRRHEQGALLVDRPVIGIERIGDSDPEPVGSGRAAQPLDGVRVVDNTHVIAGPIAARQLAELGGEVLHVSSPDHPDANALIVETGLGKRNAYCDLADIGGAAAFWRLLADADVYVNSYNGLDARGFGADALAAARPGLVILEFSCWGDQGPWGGRGGFDQLACAATGLSIEQGGPDRPALPPTYLLNDYLAAILGSAGVLEALRRRAATGGSYVVRVELARVCMWIQDLAPLAATPVSTMPGLESVVVPLRTVAGAFGHTTYLPTQIAYSGITPQLAHGAAPLGSSPLAWLAPSTGDTR